MQIHLLGNTTALAEIFKKFLTGHTWNGGYPVPPETDLIIAGYSPTARDVATKSGKPWVWVMSRDWLGSVAATSLLIHPDLSTLSALGMEGIPAILFDEDTLEQHLQSVAYAKKNRVVFVASEVHYLKHLTPTMLQLHPKDLGVTLVPQDLARLALLEGHQTLAWGKDVSQVQFTLRRRVDPPQSLAMVVGLADQVTAEKLGFSVVRGEHGIGQTYDTSHRGSSYAGSPMHSRLYAYFAPGVHPYLQHVANCPGVAGFRVGSPFLDRFPKLEEKQTDAVGFVFHWDNQSQAETRSTWAYWVDPILDLIARGWDVKLHCHPREAANFRIKFLVPNNLESRWVETLEELHQSVDVICGDNTSAIYFMAAAGHPVVLLNHPTYRREIEHGLRFWECSDVGIPCDKKWDLEASIMKATAREDEDMAFREEALRYTFFRQAGASVIEALLLESLLEFRHRQVGGCKQSVVAIKSFDSGKHGMLAKGEVYQIPDDDAWELMGKGLVNLQTETIAKGFPWPRKEVKDMPEDRKPNERLYQVVEKFSDHGVDYKPGDFVRKEEILTNNLEKKCKVYESKARRPSRMETK